MQIKACTQRDIRDLIEISTTSYLEHYTYLWDDNGASYVSSNFNIDKISGEIANPNAIFFLVEDAQKPVGMIKLNIDSKTGNFSANDGLELERIYFIKEAAGKGLGIKAIEFIKVFSKQKSKKIIWLKAMQSSTVIEFYKKQGFTITGETHLNYPGIKSEFQKMFTMTLRL